MKKLNLQNALRELSNRCKHECLQVAIMLRSGYTFEIEDHVFDESNYTIDEMADGSVLIAFTLPNGETVICECEDVIMVKSINVENNG